MARTFGIAAKSEAERPRLLASTAALAVNQVQRDSRKLEADAAYLSHWWGFEWSRPERAERAIGAPTRRALAGKPENIEDVAIEMFP